MTGLTIRCSSRATFSQTRFGVANRACHHSASSRKIAAMPTAHQRTDGGSWSRAKPQRGQKKPPSQGRNCDPTRSLPLYRGQSFRVWTTRPPTTDALTCLSRAMAMQIVVLNVLSHRTALNFEIAGQALSAFSTKRGARTARAQCRHHDYRRARRIC
jgi:hypothetical protein